MTFQQSIFPNDWKYQIMKYSLQKKYKDELALYHLSILQTEGPQLISNSIDMHQWTRKNIQLKGLYVT